MAVASFGYSLNLKPVLEEVTEKIFSVTILVNSIGLHKTLATQATPRDMATLSDIHGLRLDYER